MALPVNTIRGALGNWRGGKAGGAGGAPAVRPPMAGNPFMSMAQGFGRQQQQQPALGMGGGGFDQMYSGGPPGGAGFNSAPFQSGSRDMFAGGGAPPGGDPMGQQMMSMAGRPGQAMPAPGGFAAMQAGPPRPPGGGGDMASMQAALMGRPGQAPPSPGGFAAGPPPAPNPFDPAQVAAMRAKLAAGGGAPPPSGIAGAAGAAMGGGRPPPPGGPMGMAQQMGAAIGGAATRPPPPPGGGFASAMGQAMGRPAPMAGPPRPAPQTPQYKANVLSRMRGDL